MWLVALERSAAGLQPQQPTSLEGIVNAYLEGVKGTVKPITLEGYDRTLRKLISTLGKTLPPLLTQQTINLFVSQRRKEGAGRTIAKELSCLRSALKFSGINPLWEIPKSLSKIPKRQAVVPTPEEFVALYHETDYFDTGIAMLLALLAGLRNDEVYRVTYDMIDENANCISIPGDIRKTGTSNLIPICNLLYEELANEIWEGSIVTLSKSCIASDLRSACKSLGIKPWYGLQPARRCLVTWAEDAGYSQDTIALVTGHTRSSMVSNYSSANGRLALKLEILEAVAKRIEKGVRDGKEIHD